MQPEGALGVFKTLMLLLHQEEQEAFELMFFFFVILGPIHASFASRGAISIRRGDVVKKK